MNTVSLHAGSQVSFETAALELWKQNCTPVNESHILPKSSISGRDPVSGMAKILKPSLILRKFAVNNALFRDLENFGLIPSKSMLQIQIQKVNIDVLVISRSAGVVLFFYLPNNERAINYISRKQATISAFCSMLSILGQSVPQHIWLLSNKGDESKELESPSLPTIQVFPRSQLAEKAKSGIDSTGLSAEVYVELCKVLNALWRPRVVKLGPIRQMAISNDQTAAKNTQKRFGNLDDFLKDCERRMVDLCPKWNDYNAGRPYMIPKMFDFQRKELTAMIGGKHSVAVDNLGNVIFDAKQPLPKDESRVRVFDDDIRGQEAEYLVYENIEWNARKTATTLMTFSNLKFGYKADHGYPLKILPEGIEDAEMDFVCISPLYGVHLFEVKGSDCFTKESTVQDRLKKAAKQLETFERCLVNLSEELEIPLKNKSDLGVKTVVFPFLSCIDLYMKSGRIRRQLTAEHVESSKVGPVCSFRYKGLDVWCLGGKPPAQWSWIMEKYVAPANKKDHDTETLYRRLCPVLTRISVITQSNVLEDAELIAHHKFSTKSKPKLEGWKTTKPVPALKSLNIMFLTDEQMNALNGPAYQVIRGSAGTGKTVLLMARMKDLLEQGCSVMVLARSASITLYDAFQDVNPHIPKASLIDRRLLYEMFPQTWQLLVEQLIGNRLPTDERDEVASRLQEDLRALHDHRRSCRVAFATPDTPWHILIDDGLLDVMQPPNHDGSKHDHELLIDVLLDTRVPNVASLWLGYDMWIFHYDNYSPTLAFPEETRMKRRMNARFVELVRTRLYRRCYHIVKFMMDNNIYQTRHPDMACIGLNRVLRNARNVIQSAHVNVVPSNTLRGHNIAGMVPRTYDLTAKPADGGGSDANILTRIHHIVFGELAENLPQKNGKWLLRHAAVIVECWRPTSFLVHHLPNFFNSRGLKTVLGCENQMRLAFDFDEDHLAVAHDYWTHSFEWLIVFLIRIEAPDTRQRYLYVPRSRAVMLLVEIVLNPADVVPYVPHDELCEGDIQPVRISDTEYVRRSQEIAKIIESTDMRVLKRALNRSCNASEMRENLGPVAAERLDRLIPEHELPEFQCRKVNIDNSRKMDRR